MSNSTPSVASIDDLLLGAFGLVVPPCENIDRAVQYFSTWSGNDKLLMLLQYGAKLLIPLMQRRAELQFRVGKREKPVSHSTEGLAKFAAQVGLTRRVSGFWGLLAVLKGISSLERNRTPSRTTLNIRRLQAVSMLFFYPLDYISFLSSPVAPLLRNVSPAQSAKASLWSIRAWGLYVSADIALLLQEWSSLSARQRAGKTATDIDVWAIRKQKRNVVFKLVSNIMRLPVILHWSIIGGIYKNERWSDILSLISGIAAFRAGWESTNLPSPKR